MNRPNGVRNDWDDLSVYMDKDSIIRVNAGKAITNVETGLIFSQYASLRLGIGEYMVPISGIQRPVFIVQLVL